MKELLFAAGVGMAGAKARHPDSGADAKVRPLSAEARHPDSGVGIETLPPSAKDSQPNDGERKHRPMLRNANIDYSHGTFFVTIQAAFNKTIFGAIVGAKSVLNELGEAVAASLRSLGERYPGTEVIEFVVMPNHVHVILRIARRRDNRKHQLIGEFGRTDAELQAVIANAEEMIMKILKKGRLMEAGQPVPNELYKPIRV